MVSKKIIGKATVFAVVFMALFFVACGNTAGAAPPDAGSQASSGPEADMKEREDGNTEMRDFSAYPDPPENQRVEYLSIYMAWDGAGGEYWDYEVSAEGIIEESGPPPAPEKIEGDDGIDILVEDELPGGRTLWFVGVSPGDTALTFITRNEGGETVAIQMHIIRVYEDLKIALLHEESSNNR